MSCPAPVAPFTVTFASNPAVPVGEGSACVIGASFTDAAGEAFTPSSISYRIDDLTSGASIKGATTVTAAPEINITVTGPENALLSDLRAFEEHQLALTVTDSGGNVVDAPIRWQVDRILPSTE